MKRVPMEQICEQERNSGWKEECDDISAHCDADVFFAVDYWAQEAGLHRDLYFKSAVWLDGCWMGGSAGLGLRKRHPAAGVRDCWAGEVLRTVRSDDRGRSFLSKLRAAAVSCTTGKSVSTLRTPVVNPGIRDSLAELRGCVGIHATSATLSEILPSAVSRRTRPGENFACASGFSHPLLRNAKDGALVKARIVLLPGQAGGTRTDADSGVR
jgi:hypothetical protein